MEKTPVLSIELTQDGRGIRFQVMQDEDGWLSTAGDGPRSLAEMAVEDAAQDADDCDELLDALRAATTGGEFLSTHVLSGVRLEVSPELTRIRQVPAPEGQAWREVPSAQLRDALQRLRPFILDDVD